MMRKDSSSLETDHQPFLNFKGNNHLMIEFSSLSRTKSSIFMHNYTQRSTGSCRMQKLPLITFLFLVNTAASQLPLKFQKMLTCLQAMSTESSGLIFSKLGLFQKSNKHKRGKCSQNYLETQISRKNLVSCCSVNLGPKIVHTSYVM